MKQIPTVYGLNSYIKTTVIESFVTLDLCFSMMAATYENCWQIKTSLKHTQK